MTLRIAILTELFVPHIGGQEYRYLELSGQLQALGHQVEVFTLSGPGLPKEEFRDGVTIHRGLHLRRYVTQGSRSFIGVFVYSLSALRDVLTRSPFDVYLFNEWPLLHVLAAEPFARGTTVMDWVEVWSKGPVEALQHLASKLPDGHIAVSEEIKSSLVGRLGVEPERIAVIHSGIDNKQYAGDSPTKEWGASSSSDYGGGGR
jgi:glycosyltransferase involved in cell wall biosynthesis